MSSFDFDLFTIGAGSGGVSASRRAGEYGARVAICESSRVGGTCVMRGCVPKKLLVYGTGFREHFADAAGFGWRGDVPTLDWGALIAAKDRELDRLEAIYRRLLATSKVELLTGRGRLIDPHTVEVDGQRYTAERILIATGGWPRMPDTPGIEHAITSNEALDLEALPERVTIVGGGYIAVEFAGIFNAAGAHVNLMVRADNVLRGFDHEIRERLADELRGRGIELHTSMQVESIDRRSSGALSLYLDDTELIETDLLMYATGRDPASAGLGLEDVGVETLDDGAILVDARSRTTVSNIYAVGDVTNRINLTPVAIAEGRALAESLFNANSTTVDYANVPTAVFSQPPVGTVGMTEHDARAAHGDDVDVYCTRFRPMKATLSGRDERITCKLVVRRSTDVVLGAHMVGEDAPEIIQGLAIAIKCGATKRDFDGTVGIHPSAAEEFVTMRFPVVDPD